MRCAEPGCTVQAVWPPADSRPPPPADAQDLDAALEAAAQRWAETLTETWLQVRAALDADLYRRLQQAVH